MKKLLNTLYVTSEDSYLSLDGENVVIFNQTQEMGRIPLHNLEAIVSFGYRGGRMCRPEYFPVLFDATGEIPGKDYGKC